MPTINLSTNINSSIELCFDLARSIDLHKISTADTNEKAIAGTTSGLIGLNEYVTWQARHLGFSQKLTTNITALDRPFYFRDEQIKGIFKSFCHEHIFKEEGEGVIIKDIFEFESPMGMLGRMFNAVYLTSYMRYLLVKRNGVIKNFAETSKWKSILDEQQYEF